MPFTGGLSATRPKACRDSSSGRVAAARRPTSPDCAERATAEVQELLRRPPRASGIDQTRWTLAALKQVVPWLADKTVSGVCRILKRFSIVYRRGQEYMHSPDPEYDEKLSAIGEAFERARSEPARHVFLYEDELTYYRRPSVAQAYALRGGPGKRARQGHRANTKRRVLGSLNANTGELFVWQRTHTRVPTLISYFRELEQIYPAAQTITVTLDNWPVHFHEDVQSALAGSRIRLLRLPTYAPWTNPIEKVWRWLKQQVLHQHEFQDDWKTLQATVTRWFERWTAPSTALLRYVGLCPD